MLPVFIQFYLNSNARKTFFYRIEKQNNFVSILSIYHYSFLQIGKFTDFFPNFSNYQFFMPNKHQSYYQACTQVSFENSK